MKTKPKKLYAIKVGNAFLATSTPDLESKRVYHALTWPNKRDAQAVADHIRADLLPEDGEVNVCEHLLLTRT